MDVEQDVLQSVARSLHRFHRDQPGDSFHKWLRIITANKVRDHVRRMRNEPPGQGGTTAMIRMHAAADPHQETPSTDDESVAGGGASEAGCFSTPALEKVRRQVKPRTWEAFWRTAVEEERPADVAAELNMSIWSVYQARARVLGRLRKELGDPPIKGSRER
jgi:RNA polymerase sigma-70 factor (ECF subfamily)